MKNKLPRKYTTEEIAEIEKALSEPTVTCSLDPEDCKYCDTPIEELKDMFVDTCMDCFSRKLDAVIGLKNEK